MTTTRTYTTLADIAAEIENIIGSSAADFDIDAIIADLRDADLITYVKTGNLTHDGYTLTDDEDAFWAVVAQHDTTA